MTKTAIIERAAGLLELPETLSAAEQNRLERCADAVLCEVAEEYLPLKKRELLNAVNGVLPYAAFARRPLRILSVRDTRGNSLRYTAMDTGLAVSVKRAEVIYTYAQDTDADEIDLAVTERVLCYGVAAEYCMVCARFEEATLYRRRFLESMRAFCRAYGNHVVPARRWGDV